MTLIGVVALAPPDADQRDRRAAIAAENLMPVRRGPEVHPSDGADDEPGEEDRAGQKPPEDHEKYVVRIHDVSPRARRQAPANGPPTSPTGSPRPSRSRCSIRRSNSFVDCRIPNVGSLRSDWISWSSSPAAGISRSSVRMRNASRALDLSHR